MTHCSNCPGIQVVFTHFLVWANGKTPTPDSFGIDTTLFRGVSICQRRFLKFVDTLVSGLVGFPLFKKVSCNAVVDWSVMILVR